LTRFALLGSMLLVMPATAFCATPEVTTTALAVTSGGDAVTTVTSESVVTLTATVLAGTTPVSSGLVDFCDATAVHCEDVNILGTAQLTSAGTAAFKFRPAIGSHSYKAVFVGTSSNAGSSSAATALLVTGTPTTATTIAQTGSAGNYTLTATVGGTASAAPTGTVSFLDSSNGNALLGTAALGAGSAGLGFFQSFNREVSQQTLPPTISAAVADFTGDGIPDLAVVAGQATEGTDTLSILAGNGDGTFKIASPISTALFPYGLFVGDFNSDGIPDIAGLVSCPGRICLGALLGKGDGTFTTVAGPNCQSCTVMAVGDFNGDGILDLLVIINNNFQGVYTLQAYLGNGDGTFTAATGATITITPTIEGNFPAIAVADFNGDGKLDVATSTGDILLGNGDGTFTAAASLATGFGPYSIVTGDFNGDGIPDLAVLDSEIVSEPETSLLVFMGKGDGSFNALPASMIADQNNSASGLTIGDIIGNGTLDLVVTIKNENDGAENLMVLLGNKDGTFTTAQGVSSDVDTNPTVVAIDDLNGDGAGDLILTGVNISGSGNITIATAALLAETHSAVATATGVAVLPLASGTHQVAASYSGDSANNASISLPTSLTAGAGMSATSVSASPSPAGNGLAVTLTGTVTGSGLTPTGTVTFYDGATLLSSGTLNSNGVAKVTWSAFAVGQHSITAGYGGDTNYTASNSMAVLLTVLNTAVPTVTVMLSASSITTAQALTATITVSGATGNPTPTGSVTLSGGGYTSAATLLISGGATINIPAGSLVVGTNSLTVTYTPDSASSTIYSPATGTASVTVTAPNLLPSVTSTSPAFTDAGGPAFMLIVYGTGFATNSTVYWGASALPTTFLSATQLSAQVTAANIANAGTNAVTVETPMPGGGTSNSMQFEVDSAGFASTAPEFSPTTASVTGGSPANYSVILPSMVQTASVSCLNLPAGATCSYSSSMVTITTSTTTPKGTYQVTVVFTETVSGVAADWILLPILLLPLVFLRMRLSKRAVWMTACLGCVLLAAMVFTTGCSGGNSNQTPPPPPQTHQVTSSAAVMLTVQ
jgi:hypothetical protein